jgi:DUF1009 family protein
MARLKASALAIEARKTLMIDRDELIGVADRENVTIVAME